MVYLLNAATPAWQHLSQFSVQQSKKPKMPKPEWHAPVNVKEGGERLTDEDHFEEFD